MIHPIVVERGVLSTGQKIANDLSNFKSRIAIITDVIVAGLFGADLLVELKSLGLDVDLFAFPAGEHYKTRETKEKIENQLFEKGFGRDSCIVALGGGVATDLAGFIAATYCRGVPFVIIPTTLLGMVDGCMGGKTGLDVPYGKNLIGAIYQPSNVYIDPNLLSKLPLKELRNGVVEMIKHGLIANADYFESLEKNANRLLELDPNVIDQAIEASCKIKLGIIEQDERENGIRRLLNFGHTVGHALEKLSSYSLPHGEAVAIGMVVESYLSMNQSQTERIRNCLIQYGLPFYLPAIFPPEAIIEAMTLDKKSVKGQPRFVQLDKIGVPFEFEGAYCSVIEESVIKNALNWMNDDLCSH